jgi:N-acetylglucosaminyldiphosphoundecaprenol N-acetyl-beta-D-mannosaminyltransferase
MSASNSLLQVDPVWVWGVPFAPWTLAQTVDGVERLVEAGRPIYFLTINLHSAMLATENTAFRAAIDSAAFVVADGMPLVWASWLRPVRLPERVTGADLFPALCERAALKGYRVFFLGGPPGVGAAAAAAFQARFPGLHVSGVESPPYGQTTPEEEEALLQRIRLARPHLLFAAFSQPKGEIWLLRNSPALEGTVCVQIGASLDFAAGRISRAPRWMQRAGLEWVFRLSREPRRLIGRYARNAAFVARMLMADCRVQNRNGQHQRGA